MLSEAYTPGRFFKNSGDTLISTGSSPNGFSSSLSVPESVALALSAGGLLDPLAFTTLWWLIYGPPNPE